MMREAAAVPMKSFTDRTLEAKVVIIGSQGMSLSRFTELTRDTVISCRKDFDRKTVRGALLSAESSLHDWRVPLDKESVRTHEGF